MGRLGCRSFLDDTPEQVLEYARDVVSEYIRKRFPLSIPDSLENSSETQN